LGFSYKHLQAFLLYHHLTVRGTQRQNVKMAAQLMSRKVGTALCHYIPGDNSRDKHVIPVILFC